MFRGLDVLDVEHLENIGELADKPRTQTTLPTNLLQTPASGTLTFIFVITMCIVESLHGDYIMFKKVKDRTGEKCFNNFYIRHNNVHCGGITRLYIMFKKVKDRPGKKCFNNFYLRHNNVHCGIITRLYQLYIVYKCKGVKLGWIHLKPFL